MSILHVGDLVTLRSYSNAVTLFDNASASASFGRPTGNLNPGDVALVIAMHRSDGCVVYVIGPSSIFGWTWGALLSVVNGQHRV